jgi:RHS repeat-associated protein
MSQQGHKTKGVKRIQTMWFYSFVFTGNDPRKGWRIPLNEIKYNEQRDEETGYGYFGARYMDHELMTGWLSVDPMADVSPNISPYHYCHWNPIRLSDPTGMLDDEWQLNVRTNELTWVSGKGGALHQTVTCITPDGSSYVQQMDGMLLRAESRWFGGNDYEVNFETGDCPQFFPRMAQVDGICVNLNMDFPIPDEAAQGFAGMGDMLMGAANLANYFSGEESQYINQYQNYCHKKFHMPRGFLTSSKITELKNNYKIMKGFGKLGYWGGGALSLLGTISEGVTFSNNPTWGNGIRTGMSLAATVAGLVCVSVPAAPFVAVGVMAWGIFDEFWGDNLFGF